jgi:hypothetical protein
MIMRLVRDARIVTFGVALCWLGAVCPAEAQIGRVDVSPFIGYRVGGPFFVYATDTTTDVYGALSYGIALDLRFNRDQAVEVLFSRQEADVGVSDPFGFPVTVRLTVDYWHAGATQQYGTGRIRPFLAGTLGVTRYGQGGASEYRFSVGGGGGVKLMANPHIGARLDGRLYATFVNGGSAIGICGPGFCLGYIRVGVSWQTDFTAGLLVAF